MILRILPFLMLPLLGLAQTNSKVEMPNVGNTNSEKQALEIKRNASFNLEEIKVRWKKAALENCAGAPCSAITVPGAPTGVVATVGSTSVSVSFVAPTNNGGRAITGYTVISNPATSPVTGTSSPINVTGLTNGTVYTFTVIATNELGNSVSSSASTAVKALTCGTGTISDLDGNSYNIVVIGTQCWTQTNLKVTKYNDGSPIDFDNTGGASGYDVGQAWSTRIAGAYTIYGNELSTGPNASTYGFLYNWYAATDARKICPSGWHVPSVVEFNVLGTLLGGAAVAGGKMKSTSSLWNPPNTGADNSSNFTAVPGGMRDNNIGIFFNIGDGSFFWTSNQIQFSTNNGATGQLQHFSASLESGSRWKTAGLAVRCLKD